MASKLSSALYRAYYDGWLHGLWAPQPPGLCELINVYQYTPREAVNYIEGESEARKLIGVWEEEQRATAALQSVWGD